MNVAKNKSSRISALCAALGYSRQAFYQQREVVEREALQEDLIIQQVLLIRISQKIVGTVRLLEMMDTFLSEHKIQIGRDKLNSLLRSRNLLVRRRKRRVPITTFSDHWLRKYPNLIVNVLP